VVETKYQDTRPAAKAILLPGREGSRGFEYLAHVGNLEEYVLRTETTLADGYNSVTKDGVPGIVHGCTKVSNGRVVHTFKNVLRKEIEIPPYSHIDLDLAARVLNT